MTEYPIRHFQYKHRFRVTSSCYVYCWINCASPWQATYLNYLFRNVAIVYVFKKSKIQFEVNIIIYCVLNILHIIYRLFKHVQFFSKDKTFHNLFVCIFRHHSNLKSFLSVLVITTSQFQLPHHHTYIFSQVCKLWFPLFPTELPVSITKSDSPLKCFCWLLHH